MRFALAAIFLWLAGCAGFAQYSVDWHAINGGGAASTGTVYSINGTIGQHDAGPRLNGINYSVDGGFWSFLAPLQMTSSPRVQTAPATSITINSSTLNGLVNPGGLPTLAYFEWGATAGYGSYSATNALAATNAALSTGSPLTDLAPRTTYHYRVVAVNSSGISYGNDLTFATASGTWIPLANQPPGASGHMHLLSDGTVITENAYPNFGPAWYRLTPDSQGSYINGTWSTVASMNDTRLDFGSQVLKDGRVLVVGGEYGTGTSTAEVYDPVADFWTETPIPPSLAAGLKFSDNTTEILPDGRVLVAPVVPSTPGGTMIYDPVSGTWAAGPQLFRGQNQEEASWVKLADDSILTIDSCSTNSERYLPGLNLWVNDADVPVALYDPYFCEIGAALLLPDGRAFFIGSTSNTAIYTPSGNANPGVWSAGPNLPDGQGAPDSPAAMMVNGRILCALTPTPVSAQFTAPTSFYEYDYLSNCFNRVLAPGGGLTFAGAAWPTLMLDLPDGTVLFGARTPQLYVYQPAGAPLAAGKPSISSITTNADGSFHLIGARLNGISAGAAYGDDEQENSNYPLVRLTNSAGKVYYCRTYNWSRTGVVTGDAPVSTEFTLPPNLPPGNYGLVVVANGIASDPVSFASGFTLAVNPTSGTIARGLMGGPFGVSGQGYTLINGSASPLIWSIGGLPVWLNASPMAGVLAAGSTTNVVLTVSAAANTLPLGAYHAAIGFANLTGGSSQSRQVALQVVQTLVQNGGFEDVYKTNGYAEPTGWTLIQGTAANNNVWLYTWPGHVGGKVMSMGEVGAEAVLEQILPTAPGQAYLISLWMAEYHSAPCSFDLSWDGVSLYYTTNAPVSPGFANLQFLATATSLSTPLDIGARDDTSSLLVDEVSVTPVARIQSAVAMGGAISLTWVSTPGVAYQLLYKTDLNQPNWQELGAPIIATDTITRANVPIGPDAVRFYLVERAP